MLNAPTPAMLADALHRAGNLDVSEEAMDDLVEPTWFRD